MLAQYDVVEWFRSGVALTHHLHVNCIRRGGSVCPRCGLRFHTASWALRGVRPDDCVSCNIVWVYHHLTIILEQKVCPLKPTQDKGTGFTAQPSVTWLSGLDLSHPTSGLLEVSCFFFLIGGGNAVPLNCRTGSLFSLKPYCLHLFIVTRSCPLFLLSAAASSSCTEKLH